MRTVFTTFCFLLSAVVISGALVGQEAKPADKKDSKDSKTEPKAKAKGQLPTYWGMLALSEEQKQKIYTIQNKNHEEIDKLEAQIKALKDKTAKDRLEVLTADQKKRLEEIIKNKAGG